MYAIVFVCVFGLAFGQLHSTHDLKLLVDSVFADIDHSPKDGVILENEWVALIANDDVDNDMCVTLQEYQVPRISTGMPVEVTNQVFADFDEDHDGCLTQPDMQAAFRFIDHNGDNQITMHEYETYFTHMATHLYGHGAGHGNN